jgi:glycosyltransferase involved in cell wall biosynthesis
MLKILHILFQFPGKTGSGVYLNNLIKEGAKKGHEQALVAAKNADMDYENNLLKSIFMVEFETELLPFPIPGMSDIMPYTSTKYKDMTKEQLEIWKKIFEKEIREAYEKFSPDVIISHHLWIGTAMVAEMALGVKTYSICHSTDIRQYLNNERYQEEVRKGCSHLDGVFALNIRQKEDISRIYNIDKNLIEISGGGFDTRIFHLEGKEAPGKVTKLIYAGKLSYSKGLLPFIEVYGELKNDFDIELSFAGSGSGEEAEVIKKKAAAEGIKLLGAVSQQKLGEIFRASDLFVLPSYYEGLPLVLIEALACGIPVVTTEIKGLKEFFGDRLLESGLIEFVPLPNMIDTDIPNPDSIDQFKIVLKSAVKKQIKRIQSGYNKAAPYEQDIVALSWEGVFNKIESMLINRRK